MGEADHEIGALNTLLLAMLLGFCLMAAYTIKRNSIYYFPESAATILIGCVVGGVCKLMSSKEEINFLTFDPEIFFFVFLPPMIFEAGYSLRKKEFFENFWTISLFTVFGTFISTICIGYCVYGAGLLGLVKIDTSSPLEALIFGALLSSVDPMATLSIMGNPEIKCDSLLYALVFGESVLNDAVAISLFKTFIRYFERGYDFTTYTILELMVDFTLVSVGSIIIGVGIGFVCCYLFKTSQLKNYPDYEVSFLFLFAYGSYAFTEALQLSGIMSLFFCGVVLSHYNSTNLSPTSQVTSHMIFKTLAVLCETFVFLYLGLGIFTRKHEEFTFTFLFLCILFCFIGRLFNIFPLSAIANLGRKHPIPFKMQGVIWFAGLRGAISFALAQNMPGEHRGLFKSTTLGIIVFTTLVCGGLTEPILTAAGMKVKDLPAISVHQSPLKGRGESHPNIATVTEETALLILERDIELTDSSSGTCSPALSQSSKIINIQLWKERLFQIFGSEAYGRYDS